MPSRDELRNVAIVAHVDHGKTTLVDAMLRQQAGTFGPRRVVDRVLDSLDLEREKGITILAKQAAFRFGTRRLNVVDTPGHADFGGEVERGLAMVDGAMLLVDASEGPAAPDAIRAAQGLRGRAAGVPIVNKVDRPDARIAEVVEETIELFLDLEAPDSQYEIPFLFGSARDGWLTFEQPEGTGRTAPPRAAISRPLVETLFKHLPAP